MDVRRNSHLHRDWKDEKSNTRGSLQLGNSSVESSESHGNHKWLQKSRKAGMTGVPGAGEDGVSDASEISDDEQSTATLDPVLDAQLIDLFHSDTENEDFNGF